MTYNACQSLPHREKLKLKIRVQETKSFRYMHTTYVSISRYTQTI